MEELQPVVRRTLRSLQESEEHAGAVFLNDVDRVCLSLSRSSAELGELLNAVFVTRTLVLDEECVSSLRELHICINRLLVEWESTLLSVSCGEALSTRIVSIQGSHLPINYLDKTKRVCVQTFKMMSGNLLKLNKANNLLTNIFFRHIRIYLN